MPKRTISKIQIVTRIRFLFSSAVSRFFFFFAENIIAQRAKMSNDRRARAGPKNDSKYDSDEHSEKRAGVGLVKRVLNVALA